MAETEPAVAEIEPAVTVEDAGPALKRISITIPPESVDAKIKESFKTLGQQAQVPGFRRGKVPAALLEKRFGESLRREAKSQLVGTAYAKAIETHQLRPLGNPSFDQEAMEAPLESGKPLEFSIDIEVVPSFELPAIEGLEIKKPVAEVTSEHVDAELKRMLFRVGTPSRVSGPVGPGDRILARAVVRKEGAAEVLFETDRALVVVPEEGEGDEGPVLGLMIANLRGALQDRAVGDLVEIETTGPESHEREDIRGAKLLIQLSILDAEHITPAKLDEVISQLGLDDEAMLRDQILIALEQRRDMEQRTAMREQVYEHLLKTVEFPLPARLSSDQIVRAIERQRVDLLYRGVEPAEVERHLARMRGATELQSLAKLKLLFILAAFAEKFGIEVSEQEVNGRIAAMARQRGQRPDELRGELTRTGGIGEVALQIREQRTGDRLLDDCTITEMPAAEWNALVAERQRQAARG
ncbi:MAG TPA: trigger factor [Phycisphaerales bacterium]|nr:trigger factor [Phycisphaerales bacterium]HMP36953.1 trigger factor [Phycisphaerales bacterium]